MLLEYRINKAFYHIIISKQGPTLVCFHASSGAGAFVVMPLHHTISFISVTSSIIDRQLFILSNDILSHSDVCCYVLYYLRLMCTIVDLNMHQLPPALTPMLIQLELRHFISSL